MNTMSPESSAFHNEMWVQMKQEMVDRITEVLDEAQATRPESKGCVVFFVRCLTDVKGCCVCDRPTSAMARIIVGPDIRDRLELEPGFMAIFIGLLCDFCTERFDRNDNQVHATIATKMKTQGRRFPHLW
jgi:hypothetical protein